MLTGAIKGDGDLAEKDRRREHPRFQGDNLKHNVAVIAPIEALAKAKGCTPAQIALAWMLSKPVITSPVIGVSKIEQLEQLIAATKITLSDDDIAYLEELYRPVANILDDEKPRSVMVKKD